MLFRKDWLIDNVVYNTTTDTIIDGVSRWSIQYSKIFEYNDRHYMLSYSDGKTELQIVRPLEFEPEKIECPEVHLQPVLTWVLK